MITAAQCRSARTLLSWSINKLATAASVADSDIDDFERERRCPDAATIDAIRRAFEDVGAVFLPEDDVRLRADTSAAKATTGIEGNPQPPSRPQR
jgi:ribosome-binding protein aMBF1 (putative translation factor)